MSDRPQDGRAENTGAPSSPSSWRQRARLPSPWSRSGGQATPSAPPAAASPVLTAELRPAEQALRSRELSRLHALVTPLARRHRSARPGRLSELLGLCAREGLGGTALDAIGHLNEALRVYQDGHDVGGMTRTHRALGEVMMAQGNLAQSGQELGYAHQLSQRQGDVSLRVQVDVQRARLMLLQGNDSQALDYSLRAAQQVQDRNLGPGLEAKARLLHAQAQARMGGIDLAARDLLWAERLALIEAEPSERLPLALARANTLLALGYPRRAAQVLEPHLDGRDAMDQPLAQAHLQRMWGECLARDNPVEAERSLVFARNHYVLTKNNYYRVACEIAQVRTHWRIGRHNVQTRLESLATKNLTRWPLLKEALERVRIEIGSPSRPALGAVNTPWMRAVGKINLHSNDNAYFQTTNGAKQTHKPAPQASKPVSLWARLHHRLVGSADD